MARETILHAYGNRRMAALLGLGFAAGLPSVDHLIGSTLQPWLLDLGYGIEQINLFYLAAMPLAFNFVWAPVLDRFIPLAKLGRRRGWLLLIQSAMILAIAALACFGPSAEQQSLWPLFFTMIVVAFLVASHDVVADAYRIDVLPQAELGAGAAVYVNGYRLGMMAAGAGALWVADQWSWQAAYLVLAAMMSIGLLATWIAPKTNAPHPATLRESLIEPVHALWRQHGTATFAILIFVVLFKLPDKLAGAMTMDLLITGLSFEKTEIASVREILGIIVLVIGTLAGGALLTRVRLLPALLGLGILQAVSNLGFLWLAHVGHDMPTFIAVMMIENFCAGMVVAGFIAFLMSLCDKRYSATQYALFTSLMFVSGNLIGTFTGYLKNELGYTQYFLISVIAALPALLMLPWIARRMHANNNGQAPPDHDHDSDRDRIDGID